MNWFWFFLIYSFGGFLLEVAFSRATRSPKPDRKCRFLCPLCPVYGVGALAILALPDGVKQSPWLLLLCGGAAATAAEYLVGVVYERALGVPFWDYSHLPLNLGGKVCLLFSGMWGALALSVVYWVHPGVESLVAHIPPALLLPVLLLFAADTVLTVHLLRRTRTTGCLRWYDALLRARPALAP